MTQASLSHWLPALAPPQHDCRIDDPISRMNGILPACELPIGHPDYEPPSATP